MCQGLTDPPTRLASGSTLPSVDAKSEIREFLTSRRARITPEQAGLTVYGDNRRVPGLRREEVAMLAGVSADYYTQVERGNVNGVSDSVLEALVRALKLDDVERSHLFNLVRARRTANPTRRHPPKHRLRQSVQQVLDAMTSAPAYVRDEYGDLVATNTLVRALYSQLFEGQARVGRERERVVVEIELTDDRMVEALQAGVVVADVLGGPAHAEDFAAG